MHGDHQIDQKRCLVLDESEYQDQLGLKYSHLLDGSEPVSYTHLTLPTKA